MKNDANAKNGKNDSSKGNLTEQSGLKNPVSLSSPGVAKKVQKQILEDIDLYCATEYDGGHRNHLGASLIGDECSRKLWYIFRWVKHEKTTGRQQRLFNRGHREEERFIEWLEGVGCKVWADDLQNNKLYYHPESDSYVLLPSSDEMKEPLCEPISSENPFFNTHIARAKIQGIEFPQYRISGVMGHFGGSLDGIGILPERYSITEPVLLEYKTNGTGRGFQTLKKDGVALAKPMHYAQMSTYGYKYNFKYALYLNICKNDDDLHVEVVKLNRELGKQMEAKAERIILAEEAPPRLSDTPTYLACKWCHFNEICHTGAIPEKNCRSCKHAVPVENAHWHCKLHNDIIPKDFIPKGCDSHIPITTVA